MTAHGEREQLLAEIAANPEDDTSRLAFADWLDEQPTKQKACPSCDGAWLKQTGRASTYDHKTEQWIDCPKCDGTGSVPDTADRDRAEFIRVQCELDQLSGCNPVCSQEEGHRADCRYGDAGESLRRRETELLDDLPEWSRCRCPECSGRGSVVAGPGVIRAACPTCDGTGDLFFRYVDDRTHATELRTVTFARGFPDAVACTFAELGGMTTTHETRCSDSSFYDEVCIHCDATDATGSTALRGPCKARFVPTPWAIAVVRETPAVRFVLADTTPFHRDAANDGPFGSGLVWDWSSAHVPEVLMMEMADAHPDKVAGGMRDAVWWMEFETETEARDALALAAGRLVRRHAYKERT